MSIAVQTSNEIDTRSHLGGYLTLGSSICQHYHKETGDWMASFAMNETQTEILRQYRGFADMLMPLFFFIVGYRNTIIAIVPQMVVSKLQTTSKVANDHTS